MLYIITIFSIIGVIAFNLYLYNVLSELKRAKNEDIWQQDEIENSHKVIKWFYSVRHSQQRYFRNLYRVSNKQRKELEKEKLKKEIE